MQIWNIWKQMRSSLWFCLSFAFCLCTPSVRACASHQVERALSISLQTIHWGAPAALTVTVPSAANLSAFSLATFLQRGAVLLFPTQATGAQLIWHPQAGTTPKPTAQPLTYKGTGINKSPAGTKAIQAEVPAFPEQGQCWHRSRTCVGGWCMGLMCPWNFDIIMCIFSRFSWKCYEGRPCCILVHQCLYYMTSSFITKWSFFKKYFYFRTLSNAFLVIPSPCVMTW